jgi:hypothetical protein
MPSMQRHDATVGRRVRTLKKFVDLPEGTIGVIEEEYDRVELGQKGKGFIIAWESGAPQTRDAFTEDELRYLEVVE